MAKQPKKTAVNPPPDEDAVGGGFAMGERVLVVAPKSTHHGRSGVVVDFCKNGSTEWVHVDIEKEGRTRMPVKSLSRSEESSEESSSNKGNAKSEMPMPLLLSL